MKEIDSLERIQRNASRFIAGDYRSNTTGSVRKLLSKLGLPSGPSGRPQLRPTFLYKVVKELCQRTSNFYETRRFSTCKKYPRLQHKQTQLTATQGTTTDASTSRTVAQSNTKTHYLCEGPRGLEPSRQHQASYGWRCEQFSNSHCDQQGPLCSPSPLRLCHIPGCCNVPNRCRHWQFCAAAWTYFAGFASSLCQQKNTVKSVQNGPCACARAGMRVCARAHCTCACVHVTNWRK